MLYSQQVGEGGISSLSTIIPPPPPTILLYVSLSFHLLALSVDFLLLSERRHKNDPQRLMCDKYELEKIYGIIFQREYKKFNFAVC